MVRSALDQPFKPPVYPQRTTDPSLLPVLPPAGLHIDSALAGVEEADRCSGWQEGKCQGPRELEGEDDS